MWMQTFKGKRFDPFDPNPALIDIEDIAHSLSSICRYGGHSNRFYSVAEHSVLVAEYLLATWCDRKLALAGLLHDAAEAYMGDIPRPIKYRPEFAFYREAEARLDAMIFERFGLAEFIGDAQVKFADDSILADEAEEFMGNPGKAWGLTQPPLGIRFSYLMPNVYWERAFLSRFREWGGK